MISRGVRGSRARQDPGHASRVAYAVIAQFDAISTQFLARCGSTALTAAPPPYGDTKLAILFVRHVCDVCAFCAT